MSLAVVFAVSAQAQVHPSAPSYSSRPGAAYTIYLDFGGFSFSGVWGGTDSPSGTPGITPAYTTDGDATAFNATEASNIQKIWARVAEKYVAFNVNVTTLDPAVAANQAANDSARQAFYDSQAKMMHTVIGGGGGWSGGGGVGFVGTTQFSYSTTQNSGAGRGYHTNWVFSAQAPSALQFVSEASAHENGHGLTLWHQSDYTGSVKSNEYSSGNGTGNNSYAPIMGNSYNSQRGTWRNGDTGNGNNVKANQNDVAVLLSNNGFTLLDDGIGHSMATATAMGVIGGNVDPSQAKGFIAPASSANPNPIGVNNYTKDYFKFNASGGLVTLTLRDGNQLIQTGVADPGATLKSKLTIYDSVGAQVGVGSLDGSTLFSTFSMNLGAGTYFAEVTSFGGFAHTGSFGTQQYYDMGSYFLTGSGISAAVPEPGTMAALGLGALALLRRRRKSAK